VKLKDLNNLIDEINNVKIWFGQSYAL
jgi:hypothetical protein